MINFEFFEKFTEIAVVFANGRGGTAQAIYDQCQERYPAKLIYLVSTGDIICSIKCDAYESYIIVGIECPVHRFANACYYTEALGEDALRAIAEHDGPVVLDSIYAGANIKINCSTEEQTNFNADGDAQHEHRDRNNKKDGGMARSKPLLVVTENQRILDYYNYSNECVAKLPNDLVLKDRVKYIMREGMAGAKIHERRMFGIIFTSRADEGIADILHGKLNERARAYKIFLKDISYERLISIDHLDCIILVDCPVFQCEIPTHIPIISPFSVECGLSGIWKSEYERNFVSDGSGVRQEAYSAPAGLAIRDYATELMERREFKGVAYRSGDSDADMEIGTGRTGLAARYLNEK